MKLTWTPPAIERFEEIAAYIAEDNPDAAARIADRIVSATERVLKMPLLGRHGKKADTRELPIAGTPYIMIYRVKPDVIEILTIWHGAQD